MRKSKFIPRPQAGTELPKCPKCGAQMWVARVEPDKPDYDKRTYECPACENVIVEVVKYR
jgi:DNA-directed RNA polymerase subunit RPC12/RpoP